MHIGYEIWNFASAREWDFTAQMVWWYFAIAHCTPQREHWHHLLKHKMTRYARNFGWHSPLAPLATPMANGYKHSIEKLVGIYGKYSP